MHPYDPSIMETPGGGPPPNTSVESILLLIRQDIRGMKDDIEELKKTLDTKYVTQDQFWPVKTIVYGGAGIVLIGVFTYLVSSALKSQSGHAEGITTPSTYLTDSHGR